MNLLSALKKATIGAGVALAAAFTDVLAAMDRRSRDAGSSGAVLNNNAKSPLRRAIKYPD